jgi:hypothetical protein
MWHIEDSQDQGVWHVSDSQDHIQALAFRRLVTSIRPQVERIYKTVRPKFGHWLRQSGPDSSIYKTVRIYSPPGPAILFASRLPDKSQEWGLLNAKVEPLLTLGDRRIWHIEDSQDQIRALAFR